MVRRWQGESVVSQGTRLHHLGAGVGAGRDDLRAALRSTTARSWRGPAAAAWSLDLATTASGLLELFTVVDVAAAATSRGGAALVAVGAELRRADVLAAAAAVAVGQTGHVGAPPPGLNERGSAVPWRGTALDARDQAEALARSALSAAGEADVALARALRSATGNPVLARFLMAADTSDTGVPGVPANLVHDPRAAAAWWMALAAPVRLQLVRDAPASLGALDGLPAGVRDDCNRRVLAASLAAATSRLLASPAAEQRPRETRAEQAHRRSVRALAQRLVAYIAAVTAALGPPGVRPPRSLLVFDPVGAECAISVGNPDTATDVAVLVPGFGTTVRHSLSALVNDAARVLSSADRARADVGGTGATAVIAWIGYVAPDGADVATSGRARAGAVRLRRTLRGIDAAASASDPASPSARSVHLTVVGHSYGSVVAGLAATQRTGADDLVVIGSPGTGVTAAGQLQVPDGHVFVAEAHGDLVATLGRFGSDPGADRFDGRVLQSDGGLDSTGQPTSASHGHSGYYTEGTESLRNIGWVVAGRPDLATAVNGTRARPQPAG